MINLTFKFFCELFDYAFISKANYYYHLRCVRQAYLDSVKPSFTTFVEMMIPDKAENIREKTSVSTVLNINQGISKEFKNNSNREPQAQTNGFPSAGFAVLPH